PFFRVEHEPLEDPLARLVVRDQAWQPVAFRCGVLGMAADIEVQTGSVAQEDVGRAAPGHDPAKQVTGDFIRRQPALAMKSARHAVLVLDAEDALVHLPSVCEPVDGLGPADEQIFTTERSDLYLFDAF